MSSIYSTILDKLVSGESLTISTQVKATSVRRSLYKELLKLRTTLADLGLPCPISGIKVVPAGEGRLLVEASMDLETITIISTHPTGGTPNAEEL